LEASTKSFRILEHLRDTPGFQETVSDALRQRARIFIALKDFENAKKPLVQVRNSKKYAFNKLLNEKNL
jgi:hypothetical protein